VNSLPAPARAARAVHTCVEKQRSDEQRTLGRPSWRRRTGQGAEPELVLEPCRPSGRALAHKRAALPIKTRQQQPCRPSKDE
jgi:hypothetical protein